MNRIRRIVGLALDALQKIAALDDTGANEELNSTGSYSSFDEPGSVQIARKSALGRALLTDEERKTHRFRIDRDDLSRADLQTRAAAISSLIASETISPNEGRSWIGYGPYDGGEKFGNRNITVKPAKADPSSEDQTDGE